MPVGDPSLGWVRLLVRLPAGMTLKATSKQHLNKAVRRRLGPADLAGDPWVLDRLFGNTGPVELKRWWTVSGAIPSVPAYDPSRVGYDLATLLARESDLEVEPDLPSTAFGRESAPAITGQRGSAAAGVGAAGLAGAGVEAAGAEPRQLPCSRSKTWALDAVRAREAWELLPPDGGSGRGQGIRIGHIDTGYSDHPELERAALDLNSDYDVIDDDQDARDPLRRAFFAVLDNPGHGTLTGSVIAGRERGSIRGCAPLATLVPIRAIKSVVQVLDSDVARAVNVARQRDCQIISMSLGGRGFIGLQEAIRAAVADGMIVMAAAGNKVTFVVAPASYPECLAVAATNCDSVPWHDSSRGEAVDISAPGESVWGAVVTTASAPPGFVIGRTDGTSLSVATLAGVAALWLAYHGPGRIRRKYGKANVQAAFLSLLRSHGRRVPPGWVANGWQLKFGVGIVDAVALLQAGLPDLPGPPSLSETAAEALPEAAEGVVSRLRAALGGLSAQQVRVAIGDLLGIGADQIDGLAPTVVSELVYRLGEDDQLREAVLSPFVADRPETAGADRQGTAPEAARSPAAAGATARALLERTSSVAMRGVLIG